MASPEFEQKGNFREKFWRYAGFGLVGLIAIVAVIDIVSPQISALENSLNPA